MARLSPSDLGQALNFLGEAEDVEGPDPFPVRVLDRLRKLVRADSVSWHEWSVDEGTHHYTIATSHPEQTAAVWDAYPQYRLQDPLPGGCPGAGPPSRTSIGRALKVSDFLSVREFRRLDLHAFVCRPLGVDYVMKLFLPIRDGIARSFVFDRGRRDFEERDRLLVDVLHPHFVALCEAARNRRVLAALEARGESAQSLVVVGSSGAVDFAGSDARELLHRYFASESGRRLPDVVSRWLRAESTRLNRERERIFPARPLVIERDDRRLVVQLLRDVLLLREEVASLTRREHEILQLVAEGRSNAEIAIQLFLSVGTVRIHLQHIYAKLGVRSRTAAVARVRQLQTEPPSGSCLVAPAG
jgi:DNA-binding CsgD family transcriptional regulator